MYEALLALGASTVGPVVKRSGVAYSNIYEILERLIEKGLVSFITKEKTKYFQAAEPGRLQEYLEKKEDEIKKNKSLLSDILPQIQELQKVAPKENAEIFIGLKGLMTAYENLSQGIKKNDKLYFFYMHDPKYYEISEKFYIKSWKLFKKLQITGYGISNIEYKKTKLAESYPKFIKQKYVDFPVPANIDLFSDKLLLISWGERPLGILIQSQQIVLQHVLPRGFHRCRYYGLWHASKRDLSSRAWLLLILLKPMDGNVPITLADLLVVLSQLGEDEDLKEPNENKPTPCCPYCGSARTTLLGELPRSGMT